MSLLEIIGFASAVFMGILLGLIGGGGSILTIPILVYLFGIEPILSTAYSLFIVGITSLVGSISYIRAGLVKIKIAVLFGIPSILTVYLVRRFVMPNIPDPIFLFGNLKIEKALFILVLFALLMIMAALSMIRKKQPKAGPKENTKANALLVLAEGILVGGLTGMVGAGGGFLIIPALVLLTGLGMKEAVGTSLLIIAFKSLIGFMGDLTTGQPLDLNFLALFSLLAISGILIGIYLSKYISNEKLKSSFGYFVLIMGSYILLKELFLS